MKKFITIVVWCIISLSLNAQSGNLDSEQEEYSIIRALTETNWIGSGVLMGKEASFKMDWQTVLNDRFLKLEFQNKRKSGDNEYMVFKATAFYKIVNDTMVVGNWFDSRGITFPLRGSVRNNEMTILWGNDETEMGKTIYRYIKDKDEIVVEDFVMNNGKYLKFGNATYFTKD